MDLSKKLQNDKGAYQSFVDFLTINVSEFFRDPNRWMELEKEIFPELLAGRKPLKIWSAACSNGAEPYSLAIILKEIAPHSNQNHILATDIDKNILAVAQQGIYKSDAIRHVTRERLQKFFTARGNDFLLKDEIKKMVSFRQIDLLTQPFGSGFDLVLCRNVSIYFTRAAQDSLNSKLAQCLAKGGFLFVGGSEMIFNYKELGLERFKTSFYRKVTASGR